MWLKLRVCCVSTISMINAFIEFVGIDTRIDINVRSNVSFWGNIFSISPIDILLHIKWLSFVSSLLNKTKEIPSSGYQTFNLAQEHDVKWCSSFISKTFLPHIYKSLLQWNFFYQVKIFIAIYNIIHLGMINLILNKFTGFTYT